MPSMSVIKPLVFLLCLLPLARLVWLGLDDGLGANPLEFVTRATGLWALVGLCATLAITPLRRLTGRPQWLRLRRMLGLFAFFYACLHLAMWIWVDHDFEPEAALRDVVKRPFIAVGLLTWLLLLPLALTSTQAMIRRLGPLWRRLHRLVYAAALLAVVHFWWMRADKNDLAQPRLYAVIIVVLLVLRVVFAWRRARIRRCPD